MAQGVFNRIFGNSGQETPTSALVPTERLQRRSTGFSEFIKWMARDEGLSVLDVGSTSPANITFFIGLGHRFHQEDLLRLASDKSLLVPDGSGGSAFDVDRFLSENLRFQREEFDAVLFWDLADYLPEPLVKPVIERIHLSMKPSAMLFSFFHTKDAGAEVPFYRYNIAARDTLELQPASSHKLQRVFQNRHVENLFHDFASIKFFLGRDNIREVLVIR
jgi:hypothetical protein